MRCHKCREEKAYQEFPWLDKRFNIRMRMCKACQAASGATGGQNETEHHVGGNVVLQGTLHAQGQHVGYGAVTHVKLSVLGRILGMHLAVTNAVMGKHPTKVGSGHSRPMPA